jgi:hypothetical protein
MRVVEGEAVEGRRMSSNGQETEEWIIPDLGVRALRELRLASGHEASEQLVNLSRSEPDPALFEVPLEYTVVDETATFLVDFAPLR